MQNKRRLSIGVIDSGIGGLTVLGALKKRLPHENYIYIADRKFYPYGEKTGEEILRRVQKLTRFFAVYQVKALVLACNTASIFCEQIQAENNFPVVGAVEGVCRAAAKLSHTKEVAVLATTLTVNSGIYDRTLKKYNVKSTMLACPTLVRMAEEGRQDKAEIERILTNIKDTNTDVIIHGCTHFGLLEPVMKTVLPQIKYLSCGEWQAQELENILLYKNLQTDRKSLGKVKYYITQ